MQNFKKHSGSKNQVEIKKQNTKSLFEKLNEKGIKYTISNRGSQVNFWAGEDKISAFPASLKWQVRKSAFYKPMVQGVGLNSLFEFYDKNAFPQYHNNAY